MIQRNFGCVIAILIGVVLGIIVGAISFLLTIPGIVLALWISLSIGLGSLVILSIAALFNQTQNDRCLYNNGTCLTVAALGTIVTSLIGLTITISPAVILVSILLGLVTLFLTVTLISWVRLILCLIYKPCHE